MKMMPRIPVVLVIGAAAIVILVLGALAGFLFLIPSLSDQIPSGGAPLVVHLTAPQPGDVTYGQTVRISTDALSTNPLTKFQLWVNGSLIAEQTPPADSSSAQMAFDWQPASLALNIIVVRAVDDRGYSADSTALRLNVVSAAPPTPVVEVPAAALVDQGQSLNQIADELGLPPDVLAAVNPGLDAAQPISPDVKIVLPIDPSSLLGELPSGTVTEPLPSLPDSGPPADTQPADPLVSPFAPAAFWLGSLSGTPPELPAAPHLITGLDGCTVTLNIIDNASNEDGFFVYALTPGAPGFVRVDSLSANTGNPAISASQTAGLGQTLYKVAAFNGGGEALSEIEAVVINDQTCATSEQTFINLTSAHLTLSAPADRVYCYASPDNSNWVRLPTNPQTFYTPQAGEVTFSEGDLPPLAGPMGASLALECWGWEGGSLNPLGSGTSGISSEGGEFTVSGSSFVFKATAAESFPYAGFPVTITKPLVPIALDKPIPSPSSVHVDMADNGSALVGWLWLDLSCEDSCPVEYDIEGFKIYDGLGQLVNTIDNPAVRSGPGSAAGGGYLEDCYTVTAYKGAAESPPSIPGCLTSYASKPPHSAINYWLNTPSNVHLTGDAQECMAHVEGTLLKLMAAGLCSESATSSRHVLVWNWQPQGCFPDPNNPCPPDIHADGYTIYELKDNGEVAQVDVIEDVHQTVSFLPPTASGGDRCFFVRAYRGLYESTDSPTTCGNPAPPSQLIADPNKLVRLSFTRVYKPGAGLCGKFESDFTWESSPAEESLALGYVRIDDEFICNGWITQLTAGGVGFSIKDWGGYPIQSATFEFDSIKNFTLYKGQSLGATTTFNENAGSCMTRVYQSDKQLNYWYESALLSAGPFGAAPEHYTYDVTDLLKSRIEKGASSIKFVLQGDQSVDVEQEGKIEICFSHYNNFHLVVNFGELP